MTLEFGDPASVEAGPSVSYLAPYSSFLVRMARRNPGRWIVVERQRVAPAGRERRVEVKRMGGRATNILRCARSEGVCVDVSTRVRGTTAVTYIRSDDER